MIISEKVQYSQEWMDSFKTLATPKPKIFLGLKNIWLRMCLQLLSFWKKRWGKGGKVVTIHPLQTDESLSRDFFLITSPNTPSICSFGFSSSYPTLALQNADCVRSCQHLSNELPISLSFWFNPFLIFLKINLTLKLKGKLDLRKYI